MERLVKDLNQLFDEFFRQEAGNRLSQFAWISFKETSLNLVKTYKPEEKKNDKSK